MSINESERHGQANEIGEQIIDDDADEIRRLRIEAELLVKLLTNPQPEAFSWRMAVNDTIVRIVEIHNGADD